MTRISMTSTDRQRRLLLLAGIVTLAALVRVAMLLWLDPIVTNEGADYLRLAQNLRDGAGYQGIFGELHVEFPPLFPLLIAWLSPFAGGAEGAARVVSLVLGVATILPVYGIAARLSGARAGLIGAALVAVHGLFVALSISTYAESTYFFLIACGMYFGLETAAHWRPSAALITGITFGLAYLVRPEALLYPLLMAGYAAVALCWRATPRKQAVLAVIVMSGAIGALMSPYVAWLSEHSGYLRFEGKSGINGLLSERLRQGYSYHEAAQGLGPHLEPVGVFLPLDQFVLQPHSGGIGEALRTMSRTIPARALSIAKDTITTQALGGLPLLLLAALGLVVCLARPGSRQVAVLFAVFGAGYVPVLLTLEFRWTRFMFPVALFLLPWGAAGAAIAVEWIRTHAPGRPAWAASIAAVVIVGVVGATTARGASIVGEFTEMRDYELRNAGRWLASQPPDDRVIAAMDVAPAYYARGRVLYLPWSSDSQVLDYLRKLGPDYLALSTEDTGRAPYVASWLEHGIPGNCAPLIATFAGTNHVVRVYRWKCGASDPQWLNQWCPQWGRDRAPLCVSTPPYLRASGFSRP